VLWLTGLSGSGKSTVAQSVGARLQQLGVDVEVLDGDAVRALMPAGFSPDERDAHVRRVAFLASRLSHHRVTVVCALISPYRASREWARSICPAFCEIFVSTPLETCEARDVKGLYARARRGEIPHFTGISDAYEPPARPDLTLDTGRVSLTDATDLVVALWRARAGGDEHQQARVISTKPWEQPAQQVSDPRPASSRSFSA
jgi:adenylylsulfate kinase